MKAYFEQKKFEPYKVGLGIFSETKITITMRNLKIKKSAFSTLILEFRPQYIYIVRSSPYCTVGSLFLKEAAQNCGLRDVDF